MQISGRFVGDAYMRPVRFARYIVISGTAATGGIYAAPTTQPVIFAPPFDRGRGMPRPYRAMYFYCPVGRGDPTPPWNRAIDAICRFGCRGEHCSPVQFFRYIEMSGQPQQTNPYYCNCRKAPPHQSPAVTASPKGGSLSCGMTHTGISRGLSKAPPGLCLRAAVRRPVRFLVRKQKNSSS